MNLERFRKSLQSALSSRLAPWLVIALSLALVSPSLASGITGDDYFHRILFKGIALPGVHGRPLDMFVFSTGDAALGQAQKDVGMVGWWADPEAKLAYLRPLSMLTHLVDYRFWPDRPWLMHVQSLLWFGLALFFLAQVYRRFETPWVACLALFFYGVDDAHGFAISWIANRNAVVALTFGLAVLLVHDLWRRDRLRWALPLGIVLLLATLLAGESGLAVAGYLFSYALFIEKGALKNRLLSLLPYALVVIGWRIAYSALGYGAVGSGLSIDPVRNPLSFAAAVVERLPALLSAELALPPTDIWVFYPVIAKWLPAFLRVWTVLVVLGLFAVFFPLIRRDAQARFWAFGAALSALPACAQVPHDRLLFWCGVGAMGMLARFFAALVERDPALGASRARHFATLGAGLLLFSKHVLFALYALPLRAQGAADGARMLARTDRAIPDTPEVEQKDVILVNPPTDAFAGYLPMLRAALGRHRPAHVRWLATGACPVTLERLDATRLRVVPQDGFLSLKSEWMQRSPARPLRAGTRVELSGMTVNVTRETPDRRPAEVEVQFSEPLESPKLLWYEWTRAGFRPFEPPPIGARTTLAKIDYFALNQPDP